MNVEQFISWFPLFVVGLAAAISLRSFRYHYPVALKQLSLLWVLIFFIDLAGHIIKAYQVNNHWLYNIYYWLQYLSLPYLYYQQIQNQYIRNIIRVFYIAFPVFVLVDSIFIEGIVNLQSLIIVIGGIFIIFLAAAYFRQLYISEENEKITRDPWFWFSFGFIINFGGTVPFLGMLNYLLEHYRPFTRFYYLYFSNSYVILLNVLIIAGYLCRTHYQESS